MECRAEEQRQKHFQPSGSQDGLRALRRCILPSPHGGRQQLLFRRGGVDAPGAQPRARRVSVPTKPLLSHRLPFQVLMFMALRGWLWSKCMRGWGGPTAASG